MGCALQALSQYKPAEQFYEMASKVSEKTNELEDVTKGDIQSNLGEVGKVQWVVFIR